MRNKFAGFSILMLFSLLSFNASCKKSEIEGVYVITSGEGSVYYDGIAFTTDLFFRCTIVNQSDILGTITAWKIVYKSGSKELIEITSENCTSYNMAEHVNLRIHPFKERILVGKSVPAVGETIFPSSGIPDHLDISVTIADENSNQSTIRFIAVVTYTEYND